MQSTAVKCLSFGSHDQGLLCRYLENHCNEFR